MRRRPLRALALAGALSVGAALAWALQPGAGGATYLGSHTWSPDWDRAGGYSALWLGPEGADFLALSDRGFWVTGRLDRDGAGAVSGVTVTARDALRDTAYGETSPFLRTDAEAVAVDPAGPIYMAFEGHHRVMRFERIDGVPERVMRRRDQPPLPHNNRGFEALAIDADGTLYALPEEAVEGAYIVLARRDGAWAEAMRLPASRGLFKAAGADVGADGRLYLLERAFLGVGFRSVVRSFARDGSDERLELATRLRRHDNLEGIHVWRDDLGLRMTLLSDDNLRWFQRTEFVEYRLGGHG
jgi:hypothetical protein